MNNKKFNLIGDNGYRLVTIDPKTVCEKADSLLRRTVPGKDERSSLLGDIRRWCETSEIGQYIIRDEFTLITESVSKQRSGNK